MDIVPVATVQIGWVTVTKGAPGIAGCALTDALVTADIHPAAFFAKTVCDVFAVKPPYTNVAAYAPPSKLYVSPATPVIVIVPVATVQVGWVTVTAGAPGVAGCALMDALLTADMQPAALFAKTECDEPAAKPLYINVAA